MHWDAYTVFSVLSGVVLVATAFAPGASAKDRLYALAGGAFFIAYGIYAAAQTTGTFVFPIWIFVIPFAAIAYFVFNAMAKGSQSAASATAMTRPRPSVTSATAPPPPTPRTSVTRPGAVSAATSPPPPPPGTPPSAPSD
jgi:hypothetical protein